VGVGLAKREASRKGRRINKTPRVISSKITREGNMLNPKELGPSLKVASFGCT